MRPGEAVMELTRIGFRFRLDGDAVKLCFKGERLPNDPATVSPLLDFIRQNKEDVRFFLKCYCPLCGGCCFIPDYEGQPLCMACDWEALLKLYPALRVKH